MQDNQQTLEGSQSKLRRDILNNSFSDLEDDHEDENLQNLEQTVRVDISETDKISLEYILRIRLIYSQSFLGQRKLSLSQITILKSFLYIPRHGEQLVRWGNYKFRTQHTVVSALQRLQFMEDSERSELTVKLKQNLKYLLIISLCLLIIRVFV